MRKCKILLFFTILLFLNCASQKGFNRYAPLQEEFSQVLEDKLIYSIINGDSLLVNKLLSDNNMQSIRDHEKYGILEKAVEEKESGIACLVYEKFGPKSFSKYKIEDILELALEIKDTMMLKKLYVGLKPSLTSYVMTRHLKDAINDSLNNIAHMIIKNIDTLSNKDFESLISKSIDKNDTSVLKLLLNFDNPLQTKESYRSPLSEALKDSSFNIFEILLKAKNVDLNFVGKSGLSPLMVAIKEGNRDAVRKLVELGADLEVRSAEEGMEGVTALLYSAWEDEVEIFDYLIEKGADPKVRDDYDHSIIPCTIHSNSISLFEKCMKYGFDLKYEVEKCDWILGPTIKYNNYTLFKKLIDAGALKQKERWFHEFITATEVGNLDIVKILHKAGADCNYVYPDSLIGCGLDPLLGAIYNGKYDVAEYLVKNGAILDRKYVKPSPQYNYSMHEMVKRNSSDSTYDLIDFIGFEDLNDYYTFIKKVSPEKFEKDKNEWLFLYLESYGDYNELKNIMNLEKLGCKLTTTTVMKDFSNSKQDDFLMGLEVNLLQFMIAHNKKHVVEYLLQKEIHKSPCENFNPLLIALVKSDIKYIDLGLVDMLISYGVNPLEKVKYKDADNGYVNAESFLSFVFRDTPLSCEISNSGKKSKAQRLLDLLRNTGDKL